MKKKLLSITMAIVMLMALLVPSVCAADTFNSAITVENKTGSTTGLTATLTTDSAPGASKAYKVFFISPTKIKELTESLAADPDNPSLTLAEFIVMGDGTRDGWEQAVFDAVQDSSFEGVKLMSGVVSTTTSHKFDVAESLSGDAGNWWIVAWAADEGAGAGSEVELTAAGRKPVDQSSLVFDVNEGNFSGDASALKVSVDAGSTVTIADKVPAGNFTKTGYTLSGWSEAKNGTATTTVTAEAKGGTKTVYAVWTANELSMANINALTLKVGTAMTELTLPVATNGTGAYTYKLTGTLPDGLTESNGKINGTPTTVNTTGVELTWTATDDNSGKSVSKKFTIKVNDATAPVFTVTNNEYTYDGTAKKATVTATVEGKKVEVTKVTFGGAADQTNVKDGGYEIKATVDGKEYTLDETLVIKPKELTVDFGTELEGKKLSEVAGTLGGIVNTDDVKIGSIAWTDKTGAIGDPSTVTIAKGDSFGYTITLAGGDAGNYEIDAGTLELKSSGGIVISGSTKTYTVTYSAGSHGNFSSDAATTEKVEKNASPKNVPVVHPHDNYRFMGWSLDGKTVVDPTAQKITKDVTFTALYEVCDHMAYMVGRSDTQFAPNGNLTRAEAATILARLTEGFSETGTYPAAPYTDLNASAWYVKYVNFAASKGIVNGRPDGTFDPDASITRAEFATMIANFAGIAQSSAASVSSDVNGHWAAGYISALEQASIVTGYEDGTFRPNRTITRAEAATMVNGAIDRTPDTNLDLAENSYTNPFTDVNAGQWFFAQVMEATVNHVTAHFHTGK